METKPVFTRKALVFYFLKLDITGTLITIKANIQLPQRRRGVVYYFYVRSFLLDICEEIMYLALVFNAG